MGSIPTTELIDQVERSFLCVTDDKEDLQKIPLLQEFENEMKIYQVKFEFFKMFFFLKFKFIQRLVCLIYHHYPIVGMFNGLELI
jgi:hypothetical protein